MAATWEPTAAPSTSLAGPVPARALRGRAVGLDVLRGVAVSLVLLNHASSAFDGAGIVGVTIFFTLSGFLITDVLERGLARSGTRYLGRFYVHRALRLFPPLLLMLAVFAVVEATLAPSGQREDLPAGLLVALTYTSNLPPFDIRFDALFHLWTLAVEEQFYVVWPFVVAWLVHRWGPRRTITGICSLVIVAVLATVVLTSPDAYKLYTLPSSWTLALLTGAAVYYGRHRLAAMLDRHVVVTRAATVLAVLALVAVSLAESLSASAATYVVGVPVIAVSSGLLVARMRRWDGRRGAVVRTFAALGTISYATYLWNLPMTTWFGNPTSFPANVLPVLCTLAAATLSWWLVERPARALRGRIDERARARGQALATAAPLTAVLPPAVPPPSSTEGVTP
jgi:peptidoglycan/LPS O-acetylase OafA/YrhL